MRDLELKAQSCKERYYWYKERGICTTCGRVWAEPGRVRCKACEDKIRVYHERRRGERAALWRERRAERIAAGICTECGSRPATDGMRMCAICRERRNDSTRKYKIIKKIEREARKAKEGKHGNRNNS